MFYGGENASNTSDRRRGDTHFFLVRNDGYNIMSVYKKTQQSTFNF